MTSPSEAPEDRPKGTGPPSFDFGFDTEEFSDRILRLQYEDTDAGEPETSGRQVYETRRSRRRLEGGNDDRGTDGPTRSTVPGRDIKVNSIILAARSDFFRTMLLSGMREAGRDKPTIVLKIAKDDEAAIVTMLRFMYSGTLPPEPLPDTDVLVKQLLIGDKYQCSSFVTAVAASLESVNFSNLTVPFCDGALSVLEEHAFLVRHEGVNRFLNRVKGVLLGKYKDVAAEWEGDAFLALSRATVAFLLQAEELEAASEAEIFDGVLRWVNQSPGGIEKRAHLMSDLSKHIRYRMISGEKLREVIGMDVMQLSRETVMDAVWFRSLGDEEKAREAAESGGKAQFRERTGVFSYSYFLEFPFLASQLKEDTDVYSDIGLWVHGTFWQLRVQVGDNENENVGLFLNPTRTSHVGEGDWAKEMRFDLGVKAWPSGWRVQVDPMHLQRFTSIDEGWGRGDAFDGLSVEGLLKSKWVSKEGIITISTYFRPA